MFWCFDIEDYEFLKQFFEFFGINSCFYFVENVCVSVIDFFEVV